MAHFVLVPGAWLGSWAWDRVVPLLEEAGHSARAVTLTGLDERRTPTPEGIDLDTHADDIVAAVESAPAGATVVLVSHSYAGLPAQQAVDRLGERLARVVHVDAAVGEDGEAFIDEDDEQSRKRAAEIAADGGWWAPETSQFEGQGFSDADRDMLARRGTPHPGGTLTQPLHLSRPLGAVSTAYVHCLQDSPQLHEHTAALARRHGWQVRELDSGHWPMLTTPRMLTDVLVAATT